MNADLFLTLMEILLRLSGLAQLILGIIYPIIRKNLGWYEELGRMSSLPSIIARTYGYYIQGMNGLLGFLSLVWPERLLEGGFWAIGISGFYVAYLAPRLVAQIWIYDFSDLFKQPSAKYGVHLLTALYLVLVPIYCAALGWNLREALLMQ